MNRLNRLGGNSNNVLVFKFEIQFVCALFLAVPATFMSQSFCGDIDNPIYNPTESTESTIQNKPAELWRPCQNGGWKVVGQVVGTRRTTVSF